jgi:hypothetical protein
MRTLHRAGRRAKPVLGLEDVDPSLRDRVDDLRAVGTVRQLRNALAFVRKYSLTRSEKDAHRQQRDDCEQLRA